VAGALPRTASPEPRGRHSGESGAGSSLAGAGEPGIESGIEPGYFIIIKNALKK